MKIQWSQSGLVFFCSLSRSFTWHILAWSADKRSHWCDKHSEGNVHKDTYTYCTLICTCTGNPQKHHRCGMHTQHMLALEQDGGVKFCFCAALLPVPCSLWQRGEGGDNDSISAADRELALNQNTPGETGRANRRALGSLTDKRPVKSARKCQSHNNREMHLWSFVAGGRKESK